MISGAQIINDSKDPRGNKQELGRKFDDSKNRWELLPWAEVEEVVEILTWGSKKYEDDNWKEVFPRSRYVGAGMRHFIAWIKGEKTDSESGKAHLAHCICCLLFLMWADKNDTKMEV